MLLVGPRSVLAVSLHELSGVTLGKMYAVVLFRREMKSEIGSGFSRLLAVFGRYVCEQPHPRLPVLRLSSGHWRRFAWGVVGRFFRGLR